MKPHLFEKEMRERYKLRVADFITKGVRTESGEYIYEELLLRGEHPNRELVKPDIIYTKYAVSVFILPENEFIGKVTEDNWNRLRNKVRKHVKSLGYSKRLIRVNCERTGKVATFYTSTRSDKGQYKECYATKKR